MRHISSQFMMQYEFLHQGLVPDDAEDPRIPSDEWETFWSQLMPKDLDLKQFRNFVNHDIWFDERSTGPPPCVGLKESVAPTLSPTSGIVDPEPATLQQSHSGWSS